MSSEKTYFITLLVLITSAAMTMAQGVDFQKGSWDDALAKAKAENKMVFVDVYTTWCGPCKVMDRDVFPKKEVGDFYNANYISYKLDAESPEQNGPQLSEKYGVNGFPTYLYLNADGEKIYQTGGAMPLNVFMNAGKKGMGMDVGQEDYAAVKKKYDSGDRSKETVRVYILAEMNQSALVDESKMTDAEMTAMDDKYVEFETLLKDYFSESPETYLNTEDIAFMTNESVSESVDFKRGDALTDYLFDNYAKFAEKATTAQLQPLNDFIEALNYYAITDAAYEGDQEKYRAYISDISGTLRPVYVKDGTYTIAETVASYEQLAAKEYALHEKDFDTFLKLSKANLEENKKEGPVEAMDYLTPTRRLLEAGKPSKQQLRFCLENFNQIAYNEHKNAYVVADLGIVEASLGNSKKADELFEEAYELLKEIRGKKEAKSILEEFKSQIVKS